MQKNSNSKNNGIALRTQVYLIIIAFLEIVICVYNYFLIPVAIIFYGLVIWYAIWSSKKRNSELTQALEDLTSKVGSTAKTTLINSPFPLSIINANGSMVWKSEKFVSTFAEVDMSTILVDIADKIKSNVIKAEKSKGEINIETLINNKNYRLLGSYIRVNNDHKKNKKKETEVNTAESDYVMILYFIDETEIKALKQKVEDQDLSMGIIMIDNYEEISQRMTSEVRPVFIAQVEKKIYDYTAQFDVVMVKTEKDTFYCVANHASIEKMTDDKFSILNEVKTVEFPDSVPATLSIAFSDDGDTGIKKTESARAAIDIALGRGGDQAIIKENANYKFFGGRTTEVEKRTKVKARMVSHGLQKLIEESDNVLLMGHSNSDMDAIGSCMGLYRFAKTLGKEAHIVNNSLGIGIDGFIDKLKQSPDYENLLIKTDEALDLISDNTLLIVTDTSRQNYVDSPEVLEKAKRVVIIDHHRRSTDFIDSALLTFQEVYASSACELVTEILEYANTKIELTELEVEALYSGIMLDTKNFTFKTGVRTFEAAAFLRRNGVDIIKVKKWFQSDILTYQAISSVVSSAEIMNNNIAIALYDKEEDTNANITAAKAADELLTIGGIVASFVLTKMGEKVYISGRSIGDINVQLILEKLGGGGHITLAGAQIEGYSLEEAKQELINRINEYFFETEN